MAKYLIIPKSEIDKENHILNLNELSFFEYGTMSDNTSIWNKLNDDCEAANKKIQENFVSSVRTESSAKETEKKVESLFNLYNKLNDKTK